MLLAWPRSAWPSTSLGVLRTVAPEGDMDEACKWWPPDHEHYDEVRELLGRLRLTRGNSVT